MQISPDQGQLMSLLVQIGNFKRVIEVGVFTGYSSLAVALALPADGMECFGNIPNCPDLSTGVIYACDISEEWTGVARKYWKEAGLFHSRVNSFCSLTSVTGVENKVKLYIKPGVDTLRELLEQPGMAESFDFAFVDADKV
jgi:predicted O-methyltransferase YrrM